MNCETCTTDEQPVEMVHYMPDEESWETAHPPVRCPKCGVIAMLTIDPTNPADVANIGYIMAQLVQAKRDQHHADHEAGGHTGEPIPAFCHHCRDDLQAQVGL